MKIRVKIPQNPPDQGRRALNRYKLGWRRPVQNVHYTGFDFVLLKVPNLQSVRSACSVNHLFIANYPPISRRLHRIPTVRLPGRKDLKQ